MNSLEPPIHSLPTQKDERTGDVNWNPVWRDWFIRLANSVVIPSQPTGVATTAGVQGPPGPRGPVGPPGFDKTQSLNFANPLNWNATVGKLAFVTLTGNTTLNLPTNRQAGTYVLVAVQDAVGGRVLSWAAGYKWPGGTAPTLVTTANAVNIITFVSDGTSMYGVGQADFK